MSSLSLCPAGRGCSGGGGRGAGILHHRPGGGGAGRSPQLGAPHLERRGRPRLREDRPEQLELGASYFGCFEMGLGAFRVLKWCEGVFGERI